VRRDAHRVLPPLIRLLRAQASQTSTGTRRSSPVPAWRPEAARRNSCALDAAAPGAVGGHSSSHPALAAPARAKVPGARESVLASGALGQPSCRAQAKSSHFPSRRPPPPILKGSMIASDDFFSHYVATRHCWSGRSER
jgi:hypothetical protein